MSAPGLTHRPADWSAGLRQSRKYASYGVVRTIPPTQTIRRVLPLMQAVGVTRIADITGLDSIGIPNFTTVRPRDPGEGISYYNGKGVTRAAAKAGALMEAIERYSGESCDHRVYYGTRDEMGRSGPTVDPAEILVPTLVSYRPDQALEWVEGFDLISATATFVPLNLVICPYEPPPGRPRIFYESTNGLASGNTREEALCHALCEVIERDAIAVAAASRDLGPAVGRILAQLGVSPPAAPDATPAPDRPLIDLDTLPPRPLALAVKLRRAGLRVYLRDVTSTAGIPAMTCSIVEPQADGQHIAHGGSGCHPDARVAVARALTEAAQSRVGHIQGGREDLPAIATAPRRFDPERVFGGGEVLPFSSIASYQHECVDDDIRLLLTRLAADGFGQVVAIDLTRPEVGIPVVRVVIPRAEAWSVYYTHIQRTRLGARAVRALGETAGGRASP
jgi:ribosomal protein S12 methylthiotransferase accessory factor YcaO